MKCHATVWPAASTAKTHWMSLMAFPAPYGPLLTDDYVGPYVSAEYGDGPCRFGDRPIQVMKPYEWLADRTGI